MELERQINAKMERKKLLGENLVQEPIDGKISTMNIRLPNGTRLIRKFNANHSVQVMYDFIESNNLEPFDILSEFDVINTYPRKKIEKTMTFEDAGLVPNATVILEEVFDESD